MARTASQVALPPNFPLERTPVRVLSGRWWRQTSPRYGALDLPHRAVSAGRCHRKGQQPRLYASSTSTAAWSELFRHTLPEVSPFEVRRAMSEIQLTGLPVVDFDDPAIQALFNVSARNLTSNDYAICRRLADLLRSRPDLFGGMLLPSAAVPGEQTLIVFSEWIEGRLEVIHRQEATAPQRFLRLFEAVVATLSARVREEAMPVIREIRRDIERAAQREVDQLRRRRKL